MEVVKKEVTKLLQAGIIYPISDNTCVSPVHVVPKKSGITVVKNELIPTRIQNSWRVCIDYRRLNQATKKDHFSLPFMDEMLDRLTGKSHYCFLDGFSRYFHICIASEVFTQVLSEIGHIIPSCSNLVTSFFTTSIS